MNLLLLIGGVILSHPLWRLIGSGLNALSLVYLGACFAAAYSQGVQRYWWGAALMLMAFAEMVSMARSAVDQFKAWREERVALREDAVEFGEALLGEEEQERPLRIYVASSWRCERQPALVEALRGAGFEVYDFKNPPNGSGFGWRQVHDDPPPWTAEVTRDVLAADRADEGFFSDFNAMKWADAIVMLQPCGRSAAMELGWASGAGKYTAVLLADGQEPELMVKMADELCVNTAELMEWLESLEPQS